MTAEWQSVGRGSAGVEALRRVARRDPALRRLVGTAAAPGPCPTPYQLVEHLRRASGRREREAAAAVIRVFLREADRDPFVSRLLVQALLPGLIVVASKLQWGRGGEWRDPDEFFGDLVSTAWLVIEEWSGQDRPYAVLDLLSAIRCRLRRQLMRNKSAATPTQRFDPEDDHRLARPETDLDQLAKMLINLHSEGMNPDEVRLLYAQQVMGFSIAELSRTTGRERRVLYQRRDRGRQRLRVSAD